MKDISEWDDNDIYEWKVDATTRIEDSLTGSMLSRAMDELQDILEQIEKYERYEDEEEKQDNISYIIDDLRNFYFSISDDDSAFKYADSYGSDLDEFDDIVPYFVKYVKLNGEDAVPDLQEDLDAALWNAASHTCAILEMAFEKTFVRHGDIDDDKLYEMEIEDIYSLLYDIIRDLKERRLAYWKEANN